MDKKCLPTVKMKKKKNQKSSKSKCFYFTEWTEKEKMLPTIENEITIFFFS